MGGRFKEAGHTHKNDWSGLDFGVEGVSRRRARGAV